MNLYIFSHIVPGWAIAAIICATVLFFAIGIIVGILLTLVCWIFVHGIQQRKYIEPYRLQDNYTHCRKGLHTSVGHSSFILIWLWNWYSHWLLLCEEQERYVVYCVYCLSASTLMLFIYTQRKMTRSTWSLKK